MAQSLGIQNASASTSAVSAESVDVWQRQSLQYIHYFGFASLMIIFIGLIVTWVGYIQNARWIWFVQFVIAVWCR
ncbi:MAG: hypothetical protein DMG93_08905 [Acidobacteria bacterium]|nr:MAG: hypothetical protein DMG93_08905 [Acidobacteriota bacterium]